MFRFSLIHHNNFDILLVTILLSNSFLILCEIVTTSLLVFGNLMSSDNMMCPQSSPLSQIDRYQSLFNIYSSLSAYSITVPDYIYIAELVNKKEPIAKRLKVPPGTGRMLPFSPENLHLWKMRHFTLFRSASSSLAQLFRPVK
ncbi:hypothetical protein CW304_11770 [Bacillus sp. UFRGS-B20]|nr:hypothetical protein CW304_11770 [Bacillus sp. UFRGS-B20]